MEGIGKKLFVLLLALLALSPTEAKADTASSGLVYGGNYPVKVLDNIPYRTDPQADPQKHKLDLYLPRGPKNVPVLFFIHGGSWSRGDRKTYALVGETFARNGIATVVISYRLSPGVKHPAHIEDVAKAFAWTKNNIARHGGRPDRIMVAGHSAGGHLASLLATDSKYLIAEKLSPRDIRAVISVSGVYTFVQPDTLEKLEHFIGLSMATVLGTNRQSYVDASPLRHVTGSEPPFLILHASNDYPTCEEKSRKFADRLTQNGVPTTCLEIPDRGHITIMLWLMLWETDPTTQTMLRFIARHADLPLYPLNHPAKERP
ncbi:MAG: alpha/beta hydrolase [Gemmataceae bacterium]